MWSTGSVKCGAQGQDSNVEHRSAVSGDHHGLHHPRERPAMAARVSFTQLRVEAELERLRAECQWDRIPAAVEHMHAARIHEDARVPPPSPCLPLSPLSPL
uniref:Tetratricopeptide repeat protein 7 N-terminal domain-containing protein n=1 Tax=Knipowitschia caucasica TaxID=637954 RepID=A0AAV2JKZ4_KNICA